MGRRPKLTVSLVQAYISSARIRNIRHQMWLNDKDKAFLESHFKLTKEKTESFTPSIKKWLYTIEER
jgi:hypothetical protein